MRSAKFIGLLFCALFSILVMLQNGKTIHLPDCNVMATVTVQNDKKQDVLMMYFGKMMPDGTVKGLGRCPVDQLKGVLIEDDNEKEQIIYK